MRRSISLLGSVFCLTSVVALSLSMNAVQAETTREFNAELSSATPQPIQILEPRFSTEEMLELAKAAAHDYGLQVIDGEPEWIWTTRDNEVSGLWGDVLLDPSTPLFRVSFRGRGIWGGAGCGGCGPIPINGITFTIDGLTSNVLLAGGGYRSLWSTPVPENTIEPRFSTEEMLELAEAAAHGYGLETIDGDPEWIWTTQGAVQQEYGCQRCAPNTPIFVASFRGTGFWAGAGCPSCRPTPINGITVMIDGLTGNVLSVGSGYRSLLSTPIPEITIEPEYTAELKPTATHVPVTPPPNAMSEAELVAIAKDEAIFNGLETFDGPPLVAWMTREEWENRIGLISHGHSERATVFVVAFHGTGEGIGFGGFANRFGEAPIKLAGFTVALHPQNGFPHTMISGFRAPPFATEYAN